MRFFLKLGSYLFHPIWMPIIGSIFYFYISPRFFPSPLIKAKILAISILTVFIPIVFFLLLKNLGLIQSMEIEKVKQRRLPLLFFSLLILTTSNFIVNTEVFPELFYFFSGTLYSCCIALFLSILRYKLSLHMIGLSGLIFFIINLSLLYSANLGYWLAFLIFGLGWTAASRLQAKAHSNTQLLVGIFVGALPQVVLYLLYLDMAY